VEELRPQVLVIDPWQSFIAGADENSFKEVSGATRFMDNLIADFGLTILLAIHYGKNVKRGPRGHSVLAGWRDTRFTLKRTGNALTVDVEPRWAKPPDPLKLVFRGGTLWEGNSPAWTKQHSTAPWVRSPGTETWREAADLRACCWTRFGKLKPIPHWC